MELRRYPTAAEFLAFARPILEATEVINGLVLGIAVRLHERPDWIDAPPYLGAVAVDGQPALMAIITPPHNLLLAGGAALEPDALALLAQNLRLEGWPVAGVVAENQLAQRFAQVWRQTGGAAAFTVRTRMRMYELRRVIFPARPAPGCLRPASVGDLDTLARWRAAFSLESLHEDPPADVREKALRLAQAGVQFLWCDAGQPVSMAALSRPTPHGISISSVYTPPEARGRGYASACVAELSQRQLDAGRDFCTLFTDLDYPTSNAIYQQIGYRPVCDFLEYSFQSS